MHAYLVTGNSEEVKNQKAEEIAAEANATLINFPLAKIEDVKELNKFLNLSTDKKYAVLIKNIHTSSTEAVNAFLKNLEEKDGFLFILTAITKYSVLSTIVSRCQVIKTSGQKVLNESVFGAFISLDTPEKLQYIEKVKTRESALAFIDQIIFEGQKKLKQKGESKLFLAKILKNAIKFRSNLKKNSSVGLTLTNFVLSLDG